MPDRAFGGVGVAKAGAETGTTDGGRPTAYDTASRMLAFSNARLLAFERFGLVVNDIAWEVLLTLFVAQERGRRLSLHRLCDDISVPMAVAVRWARALRAHRLVDYEGMDGMVAQVRLTPAADAALRELIET